LVCIVLKIIISKLKNKKTKTKDIQKKYQGPENRLGPRLSSLCILVVVVDAFGRVGVVVVMVDAFGRVEVVVVAF
jgi:hypothetical protein